MFQVSGPLKFMGPACVARSTFITVYSFARRLRRTSQRNITVPNQLLDSYITISFSAATIRFPLSRVDYVLTICIYLRTIILEPNLFVLCSSFSFPGSKVGLPNGLHRRRLTDSCRLSVCGIY